MSTKEAQNCRKCVCAQKVNRVVTDFGQFNKNISSVLDFVSEFLFTTVEVSGGEGLIRSSSIAV
jgi:hypothetical protein